MNYTHQEINITGRSSQELQSKGGGGSKTDRWRSHVTPGGQLAGQRRKGEIKNSMLALQVYLTTVFTECLESNYRIG